MHGCKIIFLFELLLVIIFLIIPKDIYAQTTTFQIGSPDVNLFHGSFMGFGAEWDPFFWNTNNQIRMGCDTDSSHCENDWQVITSRIKDMKIPIIRMMMQLYWVQTGMEPTNYNYTNPMAKSVFRYLDFACQNNIDVILTEWGWSAFPDHRYSSPTDPRFAQGIANYLKEFIVNRGYSCIKYLVIGNEPANEISSMYGFPAYVSMINNVDTALKNNGIRDRISLLAPDDYQFPQAATQLHNIINIYDYHRYASYNEIVNDRTGCGITDPTQYWRCVLWANLDYRRNDVLDNDSSGASKPIFVAESGLGDGENLQSDNTNADSLYKNAISMADYGTTLLTTRLQGASIWFMHDIYYAPDDDILRPIPTPTIMNYPADQKHTWGMWSYKNDNWWVRPVAQAWGFLTRFSPKGSIQASVNGFPMASVDQSPYPSLSPYRVGAVKRPDGGWSLFLVNRSTSATTFTIQLPSSPAHSFSQYVFNRQSTAPYPTPNQVAVAASNTNFSATGSNLSVPIGGETFIAMVENVTSATPTSAPPTPTTSPAACIADIDGSHTVGIGDLQLILTNFGSTTNTQADANKDRKVNMLDAAYILKYWGAGC